MPKTQQLFVTFSLFAKLSTKTIECSGGDHTYDSNEGKNVVLRLVLIISDDRFSFGRSLLVI